MRKRRDSRCCVLTDAALPVCISFVTKSWSCRIIVIFITQFFVFTYKCYFMLLFLVNLRFKFSIFFSLQSLFHRVQNPVLVEPAAFFFPQRIELCRYFLFHCIDYWKTTNLVVSSICSLLRKLLNCRLSLFNFHVSCYVVK